MGATIETVTNHMVYCIGTIDNIGCIVQYRGLFDFLYNIDYISPNKILGFGDNRVICIFYPKGQRPNLPYPKNEKELC